MRKLFYNWLANTIRIDGIVSVDRDTAFDDLIHYRSGGIRLFYNSEIEQIEGLKQGILLEAGFDTITPNTRINISSWAYERAKKASIDIVDNRAAGIKCYHPGYTFVEKLQTVATKFRQEQADIKRGPNFMRQYYDIYCLLNNENVQRFIGTKEYKSHKLERFPRRDLIIPLFENQAFMLNDRSIRKEYQKRYQETKALYYNRQPDFEDLLSRIKNNLHRF